MAKFTGRTAANHPRYGKLVNDDVDDRRTPPALFRKLNDRYGFTLDVAASAENALCPDYFSHRLDGLLQPWCGRVWCNPPYSRLEAWVVKAWDEVSKGNCDLAVLLLPADRCEQPFWQLHIEPFRDSRGSSVGGQIEIATNFIAGRLTFGGKVAQNSIGHKKRSYRPPFGNVLVTFKRP